MSGQQSHPIAISVAEAKRLSGLGHTKIYQLIAEGAIKTTKIGARRLVLHDSLLQLLNPDRQAA